MVVTSFFADPQVEELILRTSSCDSERNRTLALRGEDALKVVNSLQRWLDSTSGTNCRTAERRRATRLLVDLATHSKQVPDDHYLKGVKYDPNASAWFGGFSDVHQATWSTSDTVMSVVAKRLRVNEGSDKMVIHKRMCIEALTWRQFDHLNIVKFLGVFREENEGHERLTLISMRKEDNLHNFIRTTQYDPHVDRKRLLMEIGSALVYLHDQEIAHGDISLRNVLVEHGSAFLTDFGLIAIGDGSTGHLSVPVGGAVQYMAPEFLFLDAEDAEHDEWDCEDVTMEPAPTSIKTKAGDVFAYGRLILAIAIKDDPFGPVKDSVALGKVKLGYPRRKPPSDRCHGAPLSDTLWRLVTTCWQREPTARPTMRDVLCSISTPGFDV